MSSNVSTLTLHAQATQHQRRASPSCSGYTGKLLLPSYDHPFSSPNRGANHGSGSHWVYDGGAFVQRSMLIGKPVIMVSFKCVLDIVPPVHLILMCIST